MLDRFKVIQYNFAKHNVLPGYQVESISTTVSNNIGLHSARLSSPYVSLCSRVNNFETHMLWDKLFSSKDLIKLRCMRKTLHL